MRFPRPQLNYANVIATIALFVALGGAAVAAGLPKNSVGAQQLKKGAVTTKALHNKAVTAGKLAPKAVTAGKLGANAVLPGNLGNGVISTEKLGDGAVIAAKIRNGSVTTNKLNNGAVNTAKLGDGAVTVGKLAAGVIGQFQGKPLESGQTLRGTFDLGTLAVATTESIRSAVSFQFPLTNAPTVTVLEKGKTTSSCSGITGGNGQTPEAAPGNLCIYVTEAGNLDETSPLVADNVTRLGFGLIAKSEESGDYFAAGQWAVTAP